MNLGFHIVLAGPEYGGYGAVGVDVTEVWFLGLMKQPGDFG